MIPMNMYKRTVVRIYFEIWIPLEGMVKWGLISIKCNFIFYI
jgi:hypothetical protein